MNYIRLFFTLSILYLSIFSCKGQEDNKPHDKTSLIDKKLSIDSKYISSEKFKSNTLDHLFNRNGYDYVIGEYSGSSKKNFHCNIVGLFENNSLKTTYALFFDNNNILRDTLNLENKDISLDIIFENSKKGIGLGYMEIKNAKSPYFQITDLYELDQKKIKLKKINLTEKILKCEIPVQYLSEEYVGMEDYFSFGITLENVFQNSKKKTLEASILEENFNLKETLWSIDCEPSKRNIMFKDDNIIVISMETNQYYITLQEKSRNGNVRFYQYKEMSGLGSVDYNSEFFNNAEKVCSIKVLNENTIKFNWLGFYDKQSGKRLQTKNPLAEEKEMVELKKCE